MKKTLLDVLKDIETELIGKTLHGISGNASVFSVTEVDYENNNVVLDVQGKRKTWTFERLEKVWNEMYFRPAANVEVVFGGSGSSRNQVETIFASLAYVLWLNVNAKKCIAYVGEAVHPYGEIARMDAEQEKVYNALMTENNPYNPLLDPSEIPEDIGPSTKIISDAIRDDYSISELATILKGMYTHAENGMQVCSIHVFGIKYGKSIVKNNYKPIEIIKAADMNDSYYTELNKAVNIYKALKKNTYGISFAKPSKRISTSGKKTAAENILLYGVPGAGKSHMIKTNYCNDRTKMERVVFHPDYTYSDFVDQILPKVVDGQLKYEFTPGPFTTILKKAWSDPDNYYYLIVEEINRGNASAIFGEIFQLLDRKSAGEHPDEEVGESEYSITNFDIAKAVYDDETQEVYLPSNLWILGTMNTADQNVFTLDTAFQRRWIMKHIDNNVLQSKYASTPIEGSVIDWGTFASVVNDLILEANAEINSSEDKRLGAYFIGFRELQADRFPEKVLKYLWDDAFKMSRDFIFQDHLKSLECVIETYRKSTTDRLQSVLKTDVYNKMISSMNAKKSSLTDEIGSAEDTKKEE